MVSQIKIDRDPTSIPTYIREQSDSIKMVRLTANTDATFTVPAGASKAIFACDVPFWLAIGSEQVLPTLGTEVTSNGELNPVSFEVTAAQVIHVKSRSNGDFCVTYYS